LHLLRWHDLLGLYRLVRKYRSLSRIVSVNSHSCLLIFRSRLLPARSLGFAIARAIGFRICL
jgi:hypothetical protein